MRTATTPSGVTACQLCGNVSMHMRKVRATDLQGRVYEVTVGRCVHCDARPCKECKGITLDPTAKKCRHCDADIALSVPDK